MPPLLALQLSDGRPGHLTLSDGILAALRRRRPVEVRRVELRRPGWLPARALSALSNAGLGPERILRHIYGVDPQVLADVGLVVSAGGDTLAANVAARRLAGVPNVFYGSLRRYPPEDFSLVLTSYARNASRPRHAMTLKPSRFNADALALPPRPAGEPPLAGLLIGGDAGREVHFAAHDWDRLLAFAEACGRTIGTRWIVTNSRRTPDAVSDRLASLVGRGAIAELIDVRNTAPGALDSLLRRAELLAVTADSSSMVSEGVWVRRRTISLAPAHCALTADERGYRDWLGANGWIRALAIASVTPERFAAALAEITPLTENPLDALAGLLQQRLPALLP
ncbi:MAG: ELM1/GtrOC1 family putative glycosyltransferase [Pseudomonadota bacterium]